MTKILILRGEKILRYGIEIIEPIEVECQLRHGPATRRITIDGELTRATFTRTLSVEGALHEYVGIWSLGWHDDAYRFADKFVLMTA